MLKISVSVDSSTSTAWPCGLHAGHDVHKGILEPHMGNVTSRGSDKDLQSRRWLWVYYNKIPIYPTFYLLEGDYKPNKAGGHKQAASRVRVLGSSNLTLRSHENNNADSHNHDGGFII